MTEQKKRRKAAPGAVPEDVVEVKNAGSASASQGAADGRQAPDQVAETASAESAKPRRRRAPRRRAPRAAAVAWRRR